MSPSRGPLVTTRMWIDMTRPRRWSGVSSWTSVERNTAEKTSAAPARARHRSASGNDTVTSPKAVIASPQAGDGERGSPGRSARTDLTQPEKSAPRNAPAAGAAAISPNPAGTGLEHVEGEDREERRRHPEDHRVEVDHERAEDRPPPPGEAEPLADGVEPRPRDRRRSAAAAGSRAAPTNEATNETRSTA